MVLSLVFKDNLQSDLLKRYSNLKCLLRWMKTPKQIKVPNVVKCYPWPMPVLCPRAGRITQGNVKFSVSLCILVSSTDYHFSLWDMYFLLSITAYDLHPRSIFGSWHFREAFSDLEDLCCIHCGNIMLYANDNKCWLALSHLKALVNHFRELGYSSIYPAAF